jgi:hypothetical protein
VARPSLECQFVAKPRSKPKPPAEPDPPADATGTTVAQLASDVAELRRQVAGLKQYLEAVLPLLRPVPVIVPLRDVLSDELRLALAPLPAEPKELDVPPWRHLVRRRDTWRHSLSFRGRRLTVGSFVAFAKASGWGPAEAARQYDLTVEAAEEAFTYAEQNERLLALETAYENECVGYGGGAPCSACLWMSASRRTPCALCSRPLGTPW